jgi:outer membrane protein assembly factor BamA
VPGKASIAGTFEVSEIDQVFPWRVEDLPLSAAELTKWMAARDPLFGEKLPASDAFLKRLAGDLGPALAAKQFSGPVAARLIPEAGTGELRIVIRPRTQPPAIAQVDFQGAEAIPASELRRAIAGIAVGTPWSEARFREYLDTTIRPIYETRGKLRAKFPKVTAAPAEGVRGVAVIVEVDEGPDYQLTSVRVNCPGLPQDVIEKEGDFKTGVRVNFSDIGRGLERIQQSLRNNGYLKPSYKARRRLDDEKKGVELFVDVAPGDRYGFGRLIIKGLDIESEPAVRKRWNLKPGQPYNDSYPAHFLGRLRSDGVFDNLGETKHEIRTDDRTLTVDVTLVFAGEKREPPKR